MRYCGKEIRLEEFKKGMVDAASVSSRLAGMKAHYSIRLLHLFVTSIGERRSLDEEEFGSVLRMFKDVVLSASPKIMSVLPTLLSASLQSGPNGGLSRVKEMKSSVRRDVCDVISLLCKRVVQHIEIYRNVAGSHPNNSSGYSTKSMFDEVGVQYNADVIADLLDTVGNVLVPMQDALYLRDEKGKIVDTLLKPIAEVCNIFFDDHGLGVPCPRATCSSGQNCCS